MEGNDRRATASGAPSDPWAEEERWPVAAGGIHAVPGRRCQLPPRFESDLKGNERSNVLVHRPRTPRMRSTSVAGDAVMIHGHFLSSSVQLWLPPVLMFHGACSLY
ncbi:hypothetical protein PVAP13_2NG575100 [Panicum virgatum]|uniref:Uncharacterized protein n=1 Tax=Panicum virgatum TaxID=38727 RepID=A0A8T0VSI4_PANVG|nr:hypothetical protein PVAP13_2NG575100 [Panicum virgatum]